MSRAFSFPYVWPETSRTAWKSEMQNRGNQEIVRRALAELGTSAGANILEVGCGSFASHGPDGIYSEGVGVTGVDPFLSWDATTPYPNASLLAEAGPRYPTLTESSYSAVVGVSVFHFFPDLPSRFLEYGRLLGSGGVVRSVEPVATTAGYLYNMDIATQQRLVSLLRQRYVLPPDKDVSPASLLTGAVKSYMTDLQNSSRKDLVDIIKKSDFYAAFSSISNIEHNLGAYLRKNKIHTRPEYKSDDKMPLKACLENTGILSRYVMDTNKDHGFLISDKLPEAILIAQQLLFLDCYSAYFVDSARVAGFENVTVEPIIAEGIPSAKKDIRPGLYIQNLAIAPVPNNGTGIVMVGRSMTARRAE